MRILGLGLLTIASVNAVLFSSRSPTKGAIAVPIRRTCADPQRALERERARLGRRQGSNNTVESTLYNTLNGYTVNITLGSPPQQLSVKLDTGSSDLLVNVPDSTLCQQGSCTGGTYSENRSQRHVAVATDFSINYVDGRNASGDWISDDFGFAGVTPFPYTFGTGQTSTIDQGVLGIGYESNSVWLTDHERSNDSHTTLPQALVDFGYIEILFGGVDHAKYSGNLSTVPIIKDSDGAFKEFLIALSGLSLDGQSLSSGLPENALIDSGSQLTYLPDQLAETIYKQINAVSIPSIDDNIYVDCGLRSSDMSLGFKFDSVDQRTISVPISTLLIDPAQPFRLDDNVQACIFGIAKASEAAGRSILGNTFLRNAYVVFNLARNEISLAQSVSTSSSNIETIANNATVPAALPAPASSAEQLVPCSMIMAFLIVMHGLMT
ncbi:putative aspartic-type endopeptidase opsB [Cyphellophora attinorum]|uniref:Putative aspartic-type endopeptidase opsB n=1 Tax=Cyphellophora attinorum TaxID=1664694 RepID=A0A0N1HDA5_9EURO|nr:putative aspartic-type endopeptidase opsB [Phialophora attinorum]KPI42566.1 putative aspartic-type endopeptidase opsB [Phialophora attinorum]